VPAKTSPAKTAAKNTTKKGLFIGILKAIEANAVLFVLVKECHVDFC
jgi:hypothetical protein